MTEHLASDTTKVTITTSVTTTTTTTTMMMTTVVTCFGIGEQRSISRREEKTVL